MKAVHEIINGRFHWDVGCPESRMWLNAGHHRLQLGANLLHYSRGGQSASQYGPAKLNHTPRICLISSLLSDRVP
jgi:hypothetical protein